MQTLYHGSNEKIETIKNDGLFGGLFATVDANAALSHGSVLHKIELNDSDILTDYELNYNADFEVVKKVLNQELSFDESELDEICDLVLAEKNIYKSELDESRLLEIFRSGDLGEAGWECQRLRGIIAKALGYKAVETRDEHGTTYLVVNANIELI